MRQYRPSFSWFSPGYIYLSPFIRITIIFFCQSGMLTIICQYRRLAIRFIPVLPESNTRRGKSVGMPGGILSGRWLQNSFGRFWAVPRNWLLSGWLFYLLFCHFNFYTNGCNARMTEQPQRWRQPPSLLVPPDSTFSPDSPTPSLSFYSYSIYISIIITISTFAWPVCF